MPAVRAALGLVIIFPPRHGAFHFARRHDAAADADDARGLQKGGGRVDDDDGSLHTARPRSQHGLRFRRCR